MPGLYLKGKKAVLPVTHKICFTD